jgi:hypothetical protein
VETFPAQLESMELLLEIHTQVVGIRVQLQTMGDHVEQIDARVGTIERAQAAGSEAEDVQFDTVMDTSLAAHARSEEEEAARPRARARLA